MRRRWYWKLYLVLMALLTVGGLGLSFYYWEETASIDLIAEWVSLPMYVVQLIGLFGFIYWRRIASLLLWKFVFAATVLELLWAAYSIAADTGPLESWGIGSLIAMGSMAVVLLMPLLFALYIFAFRSHELWATAT